MTLSKGNLKKASAKTDNRLNKTRGRVDVEL